jgi:hypothetical protein
MDRGHFWGALMSAASELSRQFRVAQQSLAMHTYLKERYARRALGAKCAGLIASVIFCATTFADDGIFKWLGVSSAAGQYLLGIASIAAFAGSLTLMVFDWDAKAGRHGDAADRLTMVVSLFRRHRSETGAWPANLGQELTDAYWDASRAVTPIPNRCHPRLKARYLLAIAVNRIVDRAPGCHPDLIRLILIARGVRRGVALARTSEFGDGDRATTMCDTPPSDAGATPARSVSHSEGDCGGRGVST